VIATHEHKGNFNVRLISIEAGLSVSSGGKSPVAAVARTSAVGGHNPEMIPPARAQAPDVRRDVLRRVPCKNLVGCCGPVTGRSSILETNGGTQSVRINRAVEFG